MASAAVNTYFESVWARHGIQMADPADDLAMSLISNAASAEQKAILDALPVLVFLEHDGRVIFANREARLAICGDEGEWDERLIEEVLWGFLPGTAEPQTRLLGSRRSRPFHATMPASDGRMIPVEGTYAALKGSTDEAVIVAHLTGRQRAPKSNFTEDVLASLPEAVAIEYGNHILYTNPAFTRMFGYSADETGGCNMSELIMKQASPLENAALRGLLEDQGNGSFEASLRGEEMNLNIGVAPLMVNGQFAGRVFTFREASAQDGAGSWQLTGGLENHWGASVVPFP